MLPKTGSRLRSRNQVPVSSRWYIRLSQESGGRSNPRSASLPTAWRESSARTGCARRAAHERWSTACAGAPIPPAGGDLRRPASRTTQRAAWRARARSMRSSPSPPSRRPIPTASAVASSRVATASASGSRTASSRSRRRAPRYPPSARKPIAMSVRAAPNTSIRNMRRSETWAALLTQRGRPVLAFPLHQIEAGAGRGGGARAGEAGEGGGPRGQPHRQDDPPPQDRSRLSPLSGQKAAVEPEGGGPGGGQLVLDPHGRPHLLLVSQPHAPLGDAAGVHVAFQPPAPRVGEPRIARP